MDKIYNLQDVIETYAESKNKSVVFVRNPVLEKQSDVTVINAVWEYYKEHLPEDVYQAITYSDFVFVEFDDDYSAQQFVEDNFPPLNLVKDSNYWFICTVYNPQGVVVHENYPIEKLEQDGGLTTP